MRNRRKPHLALCGMNNPPHEIERLARIVWEKFYDARENTLGNQELRRIKHRKHKRIPFSSKPGLPLFWLKTFRNYEGNECITFPFGTATNPRGVVQYGEAKLNACHLMCRLVNKAPPAGKGMALHKCGNGHNGCVNPNHLYWGNSSDNAQDAQRHKSEGKNEMQVKRILQ